MCVSTPFPQSFVWALAARGGCHSRPQGTTASLSCSSRKWPASSCIEKGLLGHDHEVLHLTGVRNEWKTKAVLVLSLESPVFTLSCRLFRNTLEADLISSCFTFSFPTLVSQTWTSVKSVPTTVTCTPPVWMSPEASSAAAEKAGWGTASNVLVSSQTRKTLLRGPAFLAALPCTRVRRHTPAGTSSSLFIYSLVNQSCLWSQG